MISPLRPTRTSLTWVAPGRTSTAASLRRGASTAWTPRTFGYAVFSSICSSHLHNLALRLNPLQILSHDSFLLQTPEEMGHLSSINGCGARSCDSLWEKRTNVSRDICLSVRAEEVSLPKALGAFGVFS